MFDLAILEHCAPKVARTTMLAIINTESGSNPLAIGLNKGFKLKYPAKSTAQAQAWVSYLEKNNYNFDVGLAQVNIKNIHKYGYKAVDALDPCINLKMAADILSKNYNGALTTSRDSTEALQKALSAYNTGNYSAGFRNGYVQKVYANAQQKNIVAVNNNLPPIETTMKPSKNKRTANKHLELATASPQPKTPAQSKTLLYVRQNNAEAALY